MTCAKVIDVFARYDIFTLIVNDYYSNFEALVEG